MSLENMMEPTGEMSSEQYVAIIYSIGIGRLLVIDHPEIAELYRDGMSQPGIAARFDVKGKYGVTAEIARTSIRHAITGHAGGFGTGPYDGLIQDLDELTRLEHEHHVENGRKTAESINPETGERYVVENGTKAAAEGKGIHGQTPEQRLENARKSALARGLTPWEKEETERTYSLSLEPKYQRGSRVNNKEIAQVLNEDYHNGEEVRNARAVKKNLSRYIKTLGN